jgi:myosin-6
MFLNEATLLDNIKNRYYKDKIYVSELSLILFMTTRNHNLS